MVTAGLCRSAAAYQLDVLPEAFVGADLEQAMALSNQIIESVAVSANKQASQWQFRVWQLRQACAKPGTAQPVCSCRRRGVERRLGNTFHTVPHVIMYKAISEARRRQAQNIQQDLLTKTPVRAPWRATDTIHQLIPDASHGDTGYHWRSQLRLQTYSAGWECNGARRRPNSHSSCSWTSHVALSAM